MSSYVKGLEFFMIIDDTSVFIRAAKGYGENAFDQRNNSASTRENLSSGVCDQRRRRLDCADAQFNQRLCYSLVGFLSYLDLLRTKFKFSS